MFIKIAMDSMSIRVPYRNLKKEVEIEVEMVGVEDHQQQHRIHSNISSSPSSSSSQIPNSDSNFSSPIAARSKTTKHYSLTTLILSCTIAAGVQFGWALQLSLLTPYIQASRSKFFVL